ncbi:MAG: NAD-dependent epimerase/dehydratase family protein [Hyphomicrobiales bacterium]|nr:MAG: NAD-dependent epimerase/dehydratase family protein [Hyphomicrobiales bacterium]
MSKRLVVFGHGPVGQSTVETALRHGYQVTVAQRSKPQSLAEGVAFQPCDILDADAVARAVANADQVVVAVGFPYVSAVWKDVWPRAMHNVVEACAVNHARMVFADNMYMYGPQRVPLREDMPLTDYGMKPAVRAQITRIWQSASEAGRVKVAALRAPDFYGPAVGLSHLGDIAFGALARNRPATLIFPPDMPHAFAYVPDIGRAIITLLEAPDDAYGQAWHVPCAPTSTPRRILELGAAAIGRKLRIRSLPVWVLPVAGVFSGFMREIAEMRFTFDRPYEVDSRKFATRFWKDPTPFETGAPETARAFLKQVR